ANRRTPSRCAPASFGGCWRSSSASPPRVCPRCRGRELLRRCLGPELRASPPELSLPACIDRESSPGTPARAVAHEFRLGTVRSAASSAGDATPAMDWSAASAALPPATADSVESAAPARDPRPARTECQRSGGDDELVRTSKRLLRSDLVRRA